MSILSSLYHGEIHDNPNATHNVAPGQKQDTEKMDAESAAMGPQPAHTPESDDGAEALGCDYDQQRQLTRENAPRPQMGTAQAQQAAQQLNCVERSRNAWQAKLQGDLRPDLYYSGQQAVPCREGWVESPHTVASKLESKEEFPLG